MGLLSNFHRISTLTSIVVTRGHNSKCKSVASQGWTRKYNIQLVNRIFQYCEAFSHRSEACGTKVDLYFSIFFFDHIVMFYHSFCRDPVLEHSVGYQFNVPDFWFLMSFIIDTLHHDITSLWIATFYTH